MALIFLRKIVTFTPLNFERNVTMYHKTCVCLDVKKTRIAFMARFLKNIFRMNFMPKHFPTFSNVGEVVTNLRTQTNLSAFQAFF